MRTFVIGGIALAFIGVGLWQYAFWEHEARHLEDAMMIEALAYFSVYERWPETMEDCDAVSANPNGQDAFEGYVFVFSPAPDGSYCTVSVDAGFPLGHRTVTVNVPFTDDSISARESLTRFSLDFNYSGLTSQERVWIGLRDYARVYHLFVGSWPKSVEDIATVLGPTRRSEWSRILEDSKMDIEILTPPNAADLEALCTSQDGSTMRVRVTAPRWRHPELVKEFYGETYTSLEKDLR